MARGFGRNGFGRNGAHRGPLGVLAFVALASMPFGLVALLIYDGSHPNRVASSLDLIAFLASFYAAGIGAPMLIAFAVGSDTNRTLRREALVLVALLAIAIIALFGAAADYGGAMSGGSRTMSGRALGVGLLTAAGLGLWYALTAGALRRALRGSP